ncbi:hypothetical protein SDJN02_06004, partial [Cucurbita argyrosperma subsp. argyrosperma]
MRSAMIFRSKFLVARDANFEDDLASGVITWMRVLNCYQKVRNIFIGMSSNQYATGLRVDVEFEA